MRQGSEFKEDYLQAFSIATAHATVISIMGI